MWPAQKDRVLTDKEVQQEAINQKLAADELAQAERLMKSADEKSKKAAKIETTQPDLYLKYQKEAKSESNRPTSALSDRKFTPCATSRWFRFFGPSCANLP